MTNDVPMCRACTGESCGAVWHIRYTLEQTPCILESKGFSVVDPLPATTAPVHRAPIVQCSRLTSGAWRWAGVSASLLSCAAVYRQPSLASWSQFSGTSSDHVNMGSGCSRSTSGSHSTRTAFVPLNLAGTLKRGASSSVESLIV